MRRHPLDRAVGGRIVHHDDLRGPRATGGQIAKDAAQAGFQERPAVVRRDDDRAKRDRIRAAGLGIQADHLPFFFGGRDRFHEIFPQATCWMVMSMIRKSSQNDQRCI